jgi:hypothetical protein
VPRSPPRVPSRARFRRSRVVRTCTTSDGVTDARECHRIHKHPETVPQFRRLGPFRRAKWDKSRPTPRFSGGSYVRARWATHILRTPPIRGGWVNSCSRRLRPTSTCAHPHRPGTRRPFAPTTARIFCDRGLARHLPRVDGRCPATAMTGRDEPERAESTATGAAQRAANAGLHAHTGLTATQARGAVCRYCVMKRDVDHF